MKLRKINLMMVAALVLVSFAFVGPVSAMDKFEADLKVKEAAIVLEKFMTSPDQKAPRWLLKRAKAVVIVPNLVKAGFVIGGEFGHGVVLVRQKDGSWSPPSFLTMAEGNVGFQIGAESVDLFMLVMKQRGLDGILKGQFKAGVDASVAAGPVGRTTEAGLTGMSLHADIYSYSRSQGAYAGATLGGAGIETDAVSNKAYYGKALSDNDILYNGKATPPATAKNLMAVLKKFGKKK